MGYTYSTFSLVAVAGASLGICSVAILVTVFVLRGRVNSVSVLDRFVIVWLLYDAITHLTLVRS